jgi:hypothetical protein
MNLDKLIWRIYRDEIEFDRLDVDSKIFIRYVIDYYLLRGRQLGLLDRTAKDTVNKRFKRHLQRENFKTWQKTWKLCKIDMKEILRPYKRFENLRLKDGVIEIEEVHKAFRPRQRGGKPRLDNLFVTILILKGFFTWRFGIPQWRMIAESLKPHYSYDYGSLQSLWQHMKKSYLERCGYEINEVEYAGDIYEQYLRQRAKSFDRAYLHVLLQLLEKKKLKAQSG